MIHAQIVIGIVGVAVLLGCFVSPPYWNKRHRLNDLVERTSLLVSMILIINAFIVMLERQT